jgi:endonuclease YncB( thermonuclease family)
MKNSGFSKVFISIISLFGLIALASCGGDEVQVIDYVHDSDIVRLTHDYKDDEGVNRDFFEDGISQVTLYTCIDGDTAHFKMKDSSDSSLIKGRYYGIDTPESTIEPEPYGKPAYYFNKEKLNEANENGTIVITSTSLDTYTAPELDSTNKRYLTMIWVNTEVQDAPYDQLYLLNLWIVQEGYSYVKNVSEFPTFSDIFYAAEAQAKNLKLNLFSGEPDETYNYGDYKDVSLFDLKSEIAANLKDPTHKNKYENAKVRIQGTVVGYANHILYLQLKRLVDETSGVYEYAGINIFTSMQAIPDKYTKTNTYLQLCGLAQTSDNFGFQVTGVYSWPRGKASDENDTRVIFSPSEISDEYSMEEFTLEASALDANTDYLFQPVTVSDTVEVTYGYDSSSTPAEITLYTEANGESVPFTIYIPFLYQPDPENDLYKYTTYSDYMGKKFKVSGIYSFHKSIKGDITYQIVLRDSFDLILQD